METLLIAVRYGFSLAYGIVMVGILAGIFRKEDGRINKTNCIVLTVEWFLIGALQLVIYFELGLQVTMSTYPIHTHLVMIVVMMVFCKCSKLVALLSFLIGYMSLQMPGWFSHTVGVIFGDDEGIVECAAYIVCVTIALFVIKTFFADSVKDIIHGPKKVVGAFMIVPAAYYLFDYSTTVWTDLLYEGNYFAVQFMPFMICVAHLAFSYYYSKEMQKEYEFQHDNVMLEAQAKTAEVEIETMRQKNEATRIYRHDMRHHFAMIQAMASQGDLDGIREYVEESIAGLDSITPHRFCANERLNLVLSYFSSSAEKKGIKCYFDIKPPENIPLENKELCSLVSNALENAINALHEVNIENRTLSVRIFESDSRFLFMVENPYAYWIDFEDDMPQSTKEGHGFGTKSIKRIAIEHGGEAMFSASDGIFKVRVAIPMEEK